MGCGSLLKVIYVALEDKADELSELDVTNEAIDELDELMVDNEAVYFGGLAMPTRPLINPLGSLWPEAKMSLISLLWPKDNSTTN